MYLQQEFFCQIAMSAPAQVRKSHFRAYVRCRYFRSMKRLVIFWAVRHSRGF